MKIYTDDAFFIVIAKILILGCLIGMIVGLVVGVGIGEYRLYRMGDMVCHEIDFKCDFQGFEDRGDFRSYGCKCPVSEDGGFDGIERITAIND